jgi:hypothetical protein
VTASKALQVRRTEVNDSVLTKLRTRCVRSVGKSKSRNDLVVLTFDIFVGSSMSVDDMMLVFDESCGNGFARAR